MSNQHHSRFDWEALRGIPLAILLQEDGFSERQIRGIDDCPCPFHPDSSHARFSPDHNHIRCWPDGHNASPLDYVMARDGVEIFVAAEYLADRFRVGRIDAGDVGSGTRKLRPPGTSEPAQYWQRLLANGLATNGRQWLVTTRGFPAEFIDDLAARKLVCTNPRRSIDLGPNPSPNPETRETVAFPLWRCVEAADLETLGQSAHPTAVWQRFLDPPTRKGKPDKDRNTGPTAGAIFTTASHQELVSAKRVYICEGVLKGLAIEAAMRGWDVRATLEQNTFLYDAHPSDSLAADVEDSRRRVREIENHWKGVVWIAVTGTSTVQAVPEILATLYANRKRKPRVAIALDNDHNPAERRNVGHDTARELYRRLVVQLWDSVIVQPPNGSKDWDAMLKSKGAQAVREALARDTGELVLRPGGRHVGHVNFELRRGWELWSKFTKETGDGNSETTEELVADFVVLQLRRFETFDWSGERPQRDVLEVIGRTRGAGLKREYLSDEDYNSETPWKRMGFVHKPTLFRLFASNARDTVTDTEKVVSVIGLTRAPGESDGYRLFGGPEFHNLNNAWQHNVGCPYEFADFGGKWGGPADAATAKLHAEKIITALAGMFARPIGSLAAYWIAGTLLKPTFRQYPHLNVVGQRGTGKSTLASLLERCFGLYVAQTATWDTNYRMQSVVANHVLPVIADEISRVSQRRRGDLLAMLNQAFDAGQNVIRYGPDQYPLTIAGSLYMTGQDTIADSALESKQLAVNLTAADPKGGKEPDSATLPRWPWRMWGAWLCEHLSQSAVTGRIAAWSEQIGAMIDPGMASRNRFIACWARLFVAREYVRQWLCLPDDAAERNGLFALMKAQAETAHESGMEALEMLRAYAAIAAAEPGRHPITVNEPEAVETTDGESFAPDVKPDKHGAWIVPAAVVNTLRDHGLQFALLSPRRFFDALLAEGLLGSPAMSAKPAIGAWEGQNGHSRPARVSVRHLMAGGIRSRQWSYLVPLAVLQRYHLDFPSRGDDDE